MPHAKPVPCLLDLSIDTLNLLVKDQALKIAYNVVTHFVYDEVEAAESGEDSDARTAWEREIYLSDQVEAFKQHVLSHVPANLIEKVMEPILIGIGEAILWKKREWTPTTNMTKFTRQMYAIIKLSNILVLPSRRELDLDKVPKMIRTKLFSCLSVFRNLRKLILGSGSGGWVTEAFADKFLLGLPHMPLLVHFSLKYDCTVNVLQVLSETCARTLRVLDIERSRQVRDDSMQFILACQGLFDINIFQTDLSLQGQADVLLGLPELRHLDRGDFLADVVEHLHTSLRQNTMAVHPKLKLQEFWASEEYYFHTEEQMDLVSRYCPEVKKMLFMFQNTSCRLSVLAAFPKLEDLDLWGGSFYTDGLAELLQTIGHRLLKLSLVHVEEMDKKALALITVCCPNLIQFGMHNCDFVVDGEQAETPDDPFRDADRIVRVEREQEVKKLVTPMLELETIRIVSICPPSHLTFILSQCLNVKEIFLGMSTDISDQVFADVLANNRLEKLEEIAIQKCSKVTMQGVEMLLANCDNLRVIKNLDSFEGIHENEVKMLKLRVKEQNLDLQLEEEQTLPADLQETNFMNYKQISDNIPEFDNSIEWETGWTTYNEENA